MRKTSVLAVLLLASAAWNSAVRAEMSEDAVTCTTARGQVEACTRAISSGANSGQDLAYVYWARGMNYDVGGDYEHAIADFNQAISLGLADGYHYFERGLLLEKMGRHEDAIADFRKCSAIAAERVCADILKRLGATP
jgi:tetratricopeptide (TPR) repeat protein